jgi:hypothetical protein
MTRRLEGRSKETIWPSNSSPRVVFAEITTPIANSSPPASMAAAARVVDGGEGRSFCVFWEISVWSTSVAVKTWSRWANQLRARSFRIMRSALLVQSACFARLGVRLAAQSESPICSSLGPSCSFRTQRNNNPVLGGKLTWRLGGHSPKPPSTTRRVHNLVGFRTSVTNWPVRVAREENHWRHHPPAHGESTLAHPQ